MNDRIKSGGEQFMTVFDLTGQEDDRNPGCIPARCLQYAKGNLSSKRLSVRLAFARDDEAAFPDTFREMDERQDGVDAGMHFGPQAYREGGADAAGCARARNLIRIDSILRLPGFRLTAKPTFQLSCSFLVRSFLGAEHGRCSCGSGQGNVRIEKGVEPDAARKGIEGLEKTGSTVHDRRTSKTDPDFFYSLVYSILYQLTCTEG